MTAPLPGSITWPSPRGRGQQVDALAADAVGHGWRELFPEKYPHAGGPDHFAAYLVNSDGFEAELIATD